MEPMKFPKVFQIKLNGRNKQAEEWFSILLLNKNFVCYLNTEKIAKQNWSMKVQE